MPQRQWGALVAVTIFAMTIIAIAVFSYRPMRSNNTSELPGNMNRLQVTATIYSLGEFARLVGGDATNVVTLVSGGVEPHDYEPTTRDIARLYESDIVVINGAGLDAWAEKLRDDLETKGVLVIVANDALGMSESDDPHFWLDPVLVGQEVVAIQKAFAQKDSSRKEFYEANAKILLDKLDALDTAYARELQHCNKNSVAISHDLLGYLANRYRFKTLAVSGLSPEEEPSPRALADVASIMQRNEMRYVLFESVANPEIAQTLSSEIGVESLAFFSLENEVLSVDGLKKDYAEVMNDNLQSLKTALECYGE